MHAADFETDQFGAMEQRVAAMWCETLNLGSIEPHEDFFSLGGDSLNALDLMMLIEDRFGVTLDPVELLDRPTLRGFTEALRIAIAQQSGEAGEL